MMELITTALVIVFFHCSYQEGGILLWLRIEIDKLFYGKYFRLRKPLYDCLPCMSSIYGTVLYLLQFEFHVKHFILFIFSLAGLLYIINKYLWDMKTH